MPVAAEALLLVRVTSKDAEADLAGLRVSAWPYGESERAGIAVETSRARPGESPRTDERGRAELAVAAGREHVVRVRREGSDRTAWTKVAAVERGARRTLELHWPSDKSLTVFGRLIDAASGSGVAGMVERLPDSGGEVTVHSRGTRRRTRVEPEEPRAAADADGRFELLVKLDRPGFAHAWAPGYAAAVFALDPKHEDANAPLVVPLARAARIEVLVHGPAGAPLPWAKIEASVASYHLQQVDDCLDGTYFGPPKTWHAETDASGRALLVDLAPGVPIELSVTGDGDRRFGEPERIVLAPGELRTIDVPWGACTRVTGRLVDQRDAAISGRDVALVRADSPARGVLTQDQPAVARTVTDAWGKFAFECVEPGRWWIGAACADDDIARVTTCFVARGEPELDVLVRTGRGLAIHGRALDSEGKPVAGAAIGGYLEAGNVGLLAIADEQGWFQLAPLVEGSWFVRAAEHAPFAGSDAQLVPAGSTGVQVVLRPGGSLRGRVAVANGEPPRCEVTLVRVDAFLRGWSTDVTDQGEFTFDELLPGDYLVVARDAAGALGVSPTTTVTAGQAVALAPLELAPATLLALTYTGPEAYAHGEVLADGVPFASFSFERGTTHRVRVPPRALELQWWEHGRRDVRHALQVEAVASRTVTLDAGR